ncbi:MAG: prephenate dehydratase [Ekhidna sp.]
MSKRKVSIQGMKGSFHNEAAFKVLGKEIALVECHTFEETIQAVNEGKADYAVMAIENSLAGCIIPNYNLLRRSGLEVCGEVGIKVTLNLLALNGTSLEEIKEVHSHQMALRQCVTFLDQHENIRRVEAFDTAGSAQMIKEQNLKGVAAIAGDLAAEEYGLEIISGGIEDHLLNFTRFLILKKADSPSLSKEVNKLSVYFETQHTAGSLAQFLTVVSALGINLSKLQSFPIPSKNTHYGFYATFDVEGVDQIDQLKIMMNSLTPEHKILGAYKKGETHG